MSDVAAGGTAFIDVRKLVKRFGDKVVLDRFNLTVNRGETCVIIGGSGSGKSTFARLLVGLERADAGEIWIDGVNIARLSGRELDRVRRRFAVVFQNHALLDSMSVFDNVAFPMREETGASVTEIDKRVHLALRDLDVDDAAKMLPGELSGGMAKRVAIARAVVTNPEILVYDEPTSGLDPVSSRVVDGLIERMRAFFPELPLYVVSEFAPVGDDLRWVRYRGGLWENLARCRSAFRGKSIRLAGVLLVPNVPFRRMRMQTLFVTAPGPTSSGRPWQFQSSAKERGQVEFRIHPFRSSEQLGTSRTVRPALTWGFCIHKCSTDSVERPPRLEARQPYRAKVNCLLSVAWLSEPRFPPGR